MDLADIDTYLYKNARSYGSSASSLGSQLVGTIGAAISTKGGLATLGGVIAAIGGNVNARDQESKAEVYSNYKQSLINAAEKIKLNSRCIKRKLNRI